MDRQMDRQTDRQTDRQKALEMAMSQIDKQFGKGSVMKMSDKPQMDIEAISTGALALDLALGIGGLPKGRVVEIYGPESSGKTTLAMHVVAEAQRMGGICAYIDAEHAVDPVYARQIGVDVDELLISQPDTGEQALEITDMLVRSGAVDVVVIDSVAALTPKAEIEGDMGDTHVGLQARLMSQALRKLTANLSRTNTVCIFINQLREKIGVMFGSPETTSGGRALKFYSSIRLDIRRIESIKEGVEVVGNRTRVKVVKNKCVAEGTLVFDPSTGLTHPIENIVDEDAAATVMSVDKNGILHVRPITARFDQGTKEVLGLRLRDGTNLRVTPDHKVLTDNGWKEAGELGIGDRVARPRNAGGFGSSRPITPDQARLLGYLIGDGYVGGKTPCTFINIRQSLHDDAAAIASSMGCDTHHKGIEAAFSHRKGERNGVLELMRWAGVWGHLAPTKKIPAALFAPDVAEDVIANLVFGLLETDGCVSREQTGGLRISFASASAQLVHQLHWLLLRWGIASSVRSYDPTSQRPSIVKGRKVVSRLRMWELRIGGINNVERFADVIPMWGPRGQILTSALGDPALRKHRGSQEIYLPAAQTEPVLAYLRHAGVTAVLAAQLIGDGCGNPTGGMRQVLGHSRLRRDRVGRLADALDSEFLREILTEELYYDRIVGISEPELARVFDLEIDEFHTFVADDVVVHNCSSPFKQAEFDIMYGKGISREGSVLDVAVDLDIVKKSGAWYTYDGEQLGQGRENAKVFLAENPSVMIELYDKVRVEAGITPVDGLEVPLGHGERDEDPDDLPITLD